MELSLSYSSLKLAFCMGVELSALLNISDTSIMTFVRIFVFYQDMNDLTHFKRSFQEMTRILA